MVHGGFTALIAYAYGYKIYGKLGWFVGSRSAVDIFGIRRLYVWHHSFYLHIYFPVSTYLWVFWYHVTCTFCMAQGTLAFKYYMTIIIYYMLYYLEGSFSSNIPDQCLVEVSVWPPRGRGEGSQPLVRDLLGQLEVTFVGEVALSEMNRQMTEATGRWHLISSIRYLNLGSVYQLHFRKRRQFYTLNKYASLKPSRKTYGISSSEILSQVLFQLNKQAFQQKIMQNTTGKFIFSLNPFTMWQELALIKREVTTMIVDSLTRLLDNGSVWSRPWLPSSNFYCEIFTDRWDYIGTTCVLWRQRNQDTSY